MTSAAVRRMGMTPIWIAVISARLRFRNGRAGETGDPRARAARDARSRALQQASRAVLSSFLSGNDVDASRPHSSPTTCPLRAVRCGVV
jgi:hypothetical protein